MVSLLTKGLLSFQESLKKSGIPASNIISINFESFDERYPTEARELYDYVVKRLASGGKTYVFLDEIQQVKDFEKAVDALFIRDDTDVYITGSNSYFLSGDLATVLTGRYVELQMHPFSFNEYYHFRTSYSSNQNIESTETPSREKVFADYLLYGGLPYAASLATETEIIEYLGGVFNTIP